MIRFEVRVWVRVEVRKRVDEPTPIAPTYKTELSYWVIYRLC